MITANLGYLFGNGDFVNFKLHFAYHYPLNDRKLWNKTIYDDYIKDNTINQIEKRTEYAERKFKISLQMAF